MMEYTFVRDIGYPIPEFPNIPCLLPRGFYDSCALFEFKRLCFFQSFSFFLPVSLVWSRWIRIYSSFKWYELSGSLAGSYSASIRIYRIVCLLFSAWHIEKCLSANAIQPQLLMESSRHSVPDNSYSRLSRIFAPFSHLHFCICLLLWPSWFLHCRRRWKRQTRCTLHR